MNFRTIVLGIGTVVATFLLAGAATIELLGAGAAPGVVFLGVSVGLIAGLFADGIVSVYADPLSGIAASIRLGYAAFGVVIVAIEGLKYVNVPGADDVFSFPVLIGVNFRAAVVVASLASRGGLAKQSATV